jgi:hypothetical protein
LVDYNNYLEYKKGGTAMTAFLGSFLQYLIVMILLAAIGVLGAFAGKKLRDHKDAKLAETAASEEQQ